MILDVLLSTLLIRLLVRLPSWSLAGSLDCLLCWLGRLLVLLVAGLSDKMRLLLCEYLCGWLRVANLLGCLWVILR